MYKKLCSTLLLVVCASLLYGGELLVLHSPNKLLSLKLVQKDGLTGMSVSYKDRVVVPQIDFGIQCNGTDYYENLRYIGVSEPSLIEENYTALHGKCKNRTNRANAVTVRLAASNENPLDIELRAYDDGVCFRYLFPEGGKDSLCLTDEFTTYHIDADNKRWMQKYVTSYEGDFIYQKDDIQQGEWGYPALVGDEHGWMLITEADLSRNYCATHLNNTDDSRKYKVTYPGQGEGNGIGEVCSRAKTPWVSPWRVLIIGELKDIVESTLVEDISTPCSWDNTDWINPGRASWIYWAYNYGTQDYQICKSYVDLAAEMGWEYVLFDWNWDKMGNGGTLEDAARYAKAKGVNPLLWYNSGGDHTGVMSTPRDRLITHEKRMKEFAWLKSFGFAGVKVDFFESDKQNMMNYYIDLMEDAAANELLINLHGGTVPRGWSRTYPNLISMEAVYGAEQYNNSGYMTENGARMNCIFPFTRNVVGPMDYTPVAFTNSQHPHRTSYCHELALSVIFESGIQHWADRPEGFLQLPPEAKKHMSQVPVAWDETRFLDGYPGKYVIMARWKGDIWYLAGINGENNAKNMRVELGFLPDSSYNMVIMHDGDGQSDIVSDHRVVSNQEVIDIDCLAQGGFVLQLRKIDD